MATLTASATARPAPPSRWRRNLAWLAVALLLLWALISGELPYERLLSLPKGLADILGRMLIFPDWSYLPTAWEGMVESIQMAWIGTVIGAVFSLPLGFLGAKNVSGGPLSVVIRQVLNAIRAFPELVLAVLLIPPLGLGAVTGAVALGLHSTGTLGKLTAEVIEGIDAGPVEAARSTGASQVQTLRWGVLPQVLPEIVAFWLYRFEINVRASAVLGVVAAGGVGQSLVNTVTYREWPKAGMLLVVIVVTVILIDLVSSRIRRRIIEGGDKPSRSQIVEQPEFATELPPA
ncbi:MAG TPA: phosphonate ABC transporter, permease protein PhnE [Candidatus Limnocylindria bacterium]|nr:phosphonate ABC transporter, permease protein PhnE [Candidatus Limnocylindria bacterium]